MFEIFKHPSNCWLLCSNHWVFEVNNSLCRFYNSITVTFPWNRLKFMGGFTTESWCKLLCHVLNKTEAVGQAKFYSSGASRIARKVDLKGWNCFLACRLTFTTLQLYTAAMPRKIPSGVTKSVCDPLLYQAFVWV